MLDAEKRVKIADFGLSRIISADEEGKTKTDTGPLKWSEYFIACVLSVQQHSLQHFPHDLVAPEAMQKVYSPKSDVWRSVCMCSFIFFSLSLSFFLSFSLSHSTTLFL